MPIAVHGLRNVISRDSKIVKRRQRQQARYGECSRLWQKANL